MDISPIGEGLSKKYWDKNRPYNKSDITMTLHERHVVSNHRPWDCLTV